MCSRRNTCGSNVNSSIEIQFNYSRFIESEEEEDDTNSYSIPSQELNAAIRDLSARLENLKTCYDLISKHGLALQRALTDLESGDDLQNKTKVVSERATLFRISSNAMINVIITRQMHFWLGVRFLAPHLICLLSVTSAV